MKIVMLEWRYIRYCASKRIFPPVMCYYQEVGVITQ